MCIGYLTFLVILIAVSSYMARGFWRKYIKIVTPQVDRSSSSVDTYCKFSKWLLMSGFAFQLVSIGEYVYQIVLYSVMLNHYVNDSEDERIELNANSMVYWEFQLWESLFWPYILCQFAMVTCIFSEWAAMWFLVYVHKDASPEELLFDLENPTMLSAPGDKCIFVRQRNNTEAQGNYFQINFRKRERRLNSCIITMQVLMALISICIQFVEPAYSLIIIRKNEVDRAAKESEQRVEHLMIAVLARQAVLLLINILMLIMLTRILICMLRKNFWAEYNAKQREMCLSFSVMCIIIVFTVYSIVYSFSHIKVDPEDFTDVVNVMLDHDRILYKMGFYGLPFSLSITLCYRSPRDVLQDISKLDSLVQVSIFSVRKASKGRKEPLTRASI